MLPLALTFVFSGEHVVKRESHRVDLARELEAPLLALAAQGLQGHQQIATRVCREKTGGPHVSALMNHSTRSNPHPLRAACHPSAAEGLCQEGSFKANVRLCTLRSHLHASHQHPTTKPLMTTAAPWVTEKGGEIYGAPTRAREKERKANNRGAEEGSGCLSHPVKITLRNRPSWEKSQPHFQKAFQRLVNMATFARSWLSSKGAVDPCITLFGGSRENAVLPPISSRMEGSHWPWRRASLGGSFRSCPLPSLAPPQAAAADGWVIGSLTVEQPQTENVDQSLKARAVSHLRHSDIPQAIKQAKIELLRSYEPQKQLLIEKPYYDNDPDWSL
ncbi:hypothetical protein HPG69_011805 [Diceros bicornis minor]|uniref:Uncharacterized protein n=1 Tax=Diceros bicornis minor TaxID=77932 RepID=A0A7J7ERA8_DICBM|nr:hypothetical protein HPG69_011805 [Diceros bicornis minor]